MSEKWDPHKTYDGPCCEDCGRPYSDPGFADLVISNAIFARISTTGDENGLFCPSCLIARVERWRVAQNEKERLAGNGAEFVGVWCKFTSGPFSEG